MAEAKLILKYIELKSGHNGDGPAWIAYVQESKSRATFYFLGKALIKTKIRGEYFDRESGEKYWISNPKKAGGDRHWAGRGKVSVQSTAVAAYLKLRKLEKLDKRSFEVVEIKIAPYDQKLHKFENQ